MSVCPVLTLAQQLIRCPSISPNDAGCQDILLARLRALDFHIEEMPHGDTRNLWAWRGGDGPVLAFAGHTDVVPPGDERQWRHPRLPRRCRTACCTAAARRI